MLDTNGKYTQLTLDQARTIILAKAAAAGVTVLAGSVEDQIKEWLAQAYVEIDSNLYAVIVKEFTPTGSDLDLQNPGFPRLQPSVSSGYLQIHNGTAGSLSFPTGTIFSAPNGHTYTNPTAIVTVAPGQTGFLSVQSVSTGAAQNLPAGQTFTGGPGGTITNPQPMTGGQDLESDSSYFNRITYYKSTNASQQATVAARKELLQYYQDARLYVNSSNNGLAVPVPLPSFGLNPVVLFASGIHAGPEETQKAIDILTSRFEFANLNSFNSSLHPIIQGSSYSGIFPQAYSITVAQAVTTYVTAQLSVSFIPQTLPAQKLNLAQNFATAFAQRLVDLLSGAAGNIDFAFTPSGGPTTGYSVPVVASATGPSIAPFVSIEAIRGLITGANSAGDFGGMELLSCDNLNVEFDPNEYEQSPIILSIFAPYEGTLSKVDFVLDSLFTDGTSWFDRYIFLDPSKISISIVEV